MQQLLESIVRASAGWVEVRYHARMSRGFAVRNGRLEEASSVRLVGVGIRVFVDGVFGFASTTDLSSDGLRSAVRAAQGAARSAASLKADRQARLADVRGLRGTFPVLTQDPLEAHPLEEKLGLVLRTEEAIRKASPHIVSSSAAYGELLDEKVIVTSDGTSVRIFDSKPSLRVLAIAQEGANQAMGSETVGVTGGWKDLLARRSPEDLVTHAVRSAIDQLSAPHASGQAAVVVLDPELVGVLCHEAIGHTVEADIVLGGAITSDKIGRRVASELVTLCDSGDSTYAACAVGTLAVDDEGVPTERTVIIEQGTLRSFLHNRETAAHFDVHPTGNARAYVYSDPPIIRMRNTYLEPGSTPVEAMIEGVGDGYYLRGFAMGGQADSNAEFMFGVRDARRIENGRLGGLVRGATIAGNAFEVLRSIDAVGDDFAWENGAGYCGKGQAAKVDAGGPHVRCRLTIGGRQV
jgi:TldD protein